MPPVFRNRTLSLGWVLGLSLTLLVVAAVTAVLAIGLVNARVATEALIRERAGAELNSVTSRLDAHLAPVFAMVGSLNQAVASGQVRPDHPAAFQRFVLGQLSTVSQVTGVAIIYPGGQVKRIRRTGQVDEDESWRRMPEVQSALEWGRRANAPRLVKPIWNEQIGQTLITLQVPLSVGAEYLGVAVVAITVSDLSSFVTEISAETGQSAFILFDHDHVLASAGQIEPERPTAGQPLPRLDQVNDPVLARMWAEDRVPLPPSQTPRRASGHRIVVDGTTYSFIYRDQVIAGDQTWLIGTYARGSLVDGEIKRLLRMAMGSAVVLAIAVAAAFLLSRRLSRPVLRLAAAAHQIEESSDFEHFEPLPGSRVRELDIASRAFNRMVGGVRERQRIRELFGRYVAPEVAEVLLAGDGAGRARRRPLTALFTDLADFTALSEEAPPEWLADRLNAYLTGLCDLVARHNGVVVDFFGDGIFAIFGAPVPISDHAAEALACAREIVGFGRRFSLDASAQDGATGWGLTRVGVNTGLAIVGNFGSADRMKYGAVGDVVNTAARLQGLNKEFGTLLMAGMDTVTAAGEQHFRPLGAVSIRGRRQDVDVAEILTEPVIQA